MDTDILIEKYFSGELSETEQQELDQLLETDADFRAEFDIQQDVQKAIKLTNREEKKELLKGYEKERKYSESEKSVKPNRGWFKIAAAIALLFSLGVYIGNNTGSDSGELYDEYYQLYPNTVYSITRSGGEASIERSAFEAYEGGDYTKAIDFFKQQESRGELKNLHFYLGQAYLANDQGEEAISSFKKVIDVNEDFTQEATWYLGLSYLKSDKIELAKTVFKEIVTEDSYKAEDAQAILDDLN